MSDFSFSPFESISGYILNPLENAMNTTVSGLSSAISAPLNLASIIFIFLYGYNVMTGRVSLSMHSLLNNVVKIVVVTAMATNADTFNTYVKDIFFGDLANAIGNALNSNPASANVFDYILLKTSARYQEVLAAAWFLEKIMVGLLGSLMIMAVIVFCIGGFIVQMFAQVALVMIIGLGPLFISLYLFNATRKFTDAWITTLINFTILQVLVIMLGTIMCKIILHVLNGTYDSIYFLFPPVVVISIVGAILFRALPGIASALSSGGPYFNAGISSGGQIFTMLSSGAKTGRNAAKSAASTLSGTAGAAAKVAKIGDRGRGRF
ncbi:type IV secretion system protein VirB6 [Bartonella quintana]|uniref:Type IV secretion system protein VirB6 n=4 Tax=Bartonella TaxID=773 RepID=VIRB6_BARQU|nr:type IV secretion system protein VirB6 [Bartonella quintana]Q6FYW5.1 RecName: Full=Type IV secretion system protein VirB6 [Bartonella quintana str. Toulouse]AAM82239.1 VirB6-like protein [Bartonella quintana str. Toulouse]ETS11891.1 type IV secretion system protein virB6 [Bartonella quintana BQ2-D70]ETS13048.1 type IV secretion system protein virB6 [Bartonella quintana JK 73rel]ETS15122.1 type IV secretion system protein virB6 [Bartonella quintana JK 73]ETS16592.1 type IV secretion system 